MSLLCKTLRYYIPEIEVEVIRRNRQRTRKVTGFKTVYRPFHYNNSVNIWALGKILNKLIEKIPNEIKARGKMIAVNKQPAIQLTQYIIYLSLKKRLTSSAYLQHAWLIEDNPSACKRDRSPTPDSAVALPLKRVLRTTSSTVFGQGSTQMLMEVMFQDDQKLEIEWNDRPANVSIVSPGNDSTTLMPIDGGGAQDSARRLVAFIERELAGTRSLDHGPRLEDLHVTDIDIRLDPAVSMEPVQFDNKMQSVRWQLNQRLGDVHYGDHEELGKPGPTLRSPAIPINQTDIVMPDVPSQSSDFSAASTCSFISDIGRGVTYPSEYDGSITTGISRITET